MSIDVRCFTFACNNKRNRDTQTLGYLRTAQSGYRKKVIATQWTFLVIILEFVGSSLDRTRNSPSDVCVCPLFIVSSCCWVTADFPCAPVPQLHRTSWTPETAKEVIHSGSKRTVWEHIKLYRLWGESTYHWFGWQLFVCDDMPHWMFTVCRKCTRKKSVIAPKTKRGKRPTSVRPTALVTELAMSSPPHWAVRYCIRKLPWRLVIWILKFIVIVI